MVVVYVRDWQAMVDWYQSKLELAAVFVQPEHEFAVLGFPDGGPVLHIVGDDRPVNGRNRCVPNCAVDDFDATLDGFRANGITILEVENDEEDGYRLARIADPEGNELNIYSSSPR
jgi:catechol 2,3-dioxygenase-like lactoylglutathione lyase family enzyme